MFSTALIYILILSVYSAIGVIVMLNTNFTFGLMMLLSLIPIVVILFISLGLQREKIIRENNENLKKISNALNDILEIKKKENIDNK